MPVYGAVPHSGNRCSGLCQTPCDHADCWQCVEHKAKTERAKHTDPNCNNECRVPCGHPSCRDCFNFTYKQDKAQQRARESRPLDRDRRSVLGALPAQGPGEVQKTTVTRAALEGLCKRAGIRMDWNDGDPILHDERGWQSASSWSSTTTAKTLGRNAAETFDEQVRRIIDGRLVGDLQKSVDQISRSQAKAREDKARQELRDKGASEEDIEAAVALMGWKPGDEQKTPEPPARKPGDWKLIDISDIINSWQSVSSAKLTITAGE